MRSFQLDIQHNPRIIVFLPQLGALKSPRWSTLTRLDRRQVVQLVNSLLQLNVLVMASRLLRRLELDRLGRGKLWTMDYQRLNNFNNNVI
jgi:hypothetical protein